MLDNEKMTELVNLARIARNRAYAPYSNFKVGAAILTSNGNVFTGVNVENVSFGLTICAERSAAVAAVTAGELDWLGIAVVASSENPTTPCGACRQFLAEFNPLLSVTVANPQTVFFTISLLELLPSPFENSIFHSQKE